MAANNTIYLNVRIIEGDLPAELNIYYFRLLAAHFFEAATWLVKTRKLPAIDALIRSLSDEDQARYDRVASFASQKHPFYKRLRRSRMTLFHYPTMHPSRARDGTEELANALCEAKDIDGWIEGGDDYASFRAVFADEVALQFLAETEEATRDLMSKLGGPVFELVQFAEAVLLTQLKRADVRKTVIWKAGQERPGVA